MRFYLGFLFLALLSVNCKAQISNTLSDVNNDLYQMHQKANTNRDVKEFFQKSKLSFNSDTIYAIFIPPMTCARCEGGINPFIYRLKEMNNNADIVIIAFDEKPKVLEQYFAERQYATDKIIASVSKEFLKNFCFRSGELSIPFYTKINIATGDLLVSKASLGININDSLVNNFYNFNGLLPKCKEENDNTYTSDHININSIDDIDGIVIEPFKMIDLEENDNHPVSSIRYPFYKFNMGKESSFSFMNSMDYTIFVNRINDNVAITDTIISPKSVEKIFISRDVSDSVINLLEKMNIINSMFFKSWINDTSVMISASLPNIFWRNKVTEDLNYYNKISYLFYDRNSFALKRITIGFELPDTNYTLDHLNTSLITLNDTLFYCIPAEKGWPAVGVNNFDKNDITNNPFTKEFYEQAHSVAVFNSHGSFISYFNDLDSVYKSNLLGYYYSHPIIHASKEMIASADAATGNIYLYHGFRDKQPYKVIRTINILPFNSSIDYNDHPLDYLNDYKKVFNTFLLDFTITGGKVIAVFKNTNYYFYKILDMNGHELQKRYLPNEYKSLELKSVNIANYHGKPVIASIYSGLGKDKILLFSIDE